MKSDSAQITEMFSSIQGEGALIGRRQVFVRFKGCNLACDYCDTNIGVTDACSRMERTPGRLDFLELPNPVAMNTVMALLERWTKGWPSVHHSISLTGGEPLLHVDLLHQWLPQMREFLPVHLETNGVLHSALSRIIRQLDQISMDIKLPSSSGETSLWDHHRDFLQIAHESQVSVKVVVNQSTENWELQRSAEMIAAVAPDIPLIIQPETAVDLSMKISAIRLFELQEIASAIVPDVRIIPQTHRFIGLL